MQVAPVPVGLDLNDPRLLADSDERHLERARLHRDLMRSPDETVEVRARRNPPVPGDLLGIGRDPRQPSGLIKRYRLIAITHYLRRLEGCHRAIAVILAIAAHPPRETLEVIERTTPHDQLRLPVIEVGVEVDTRAGIVEVIAAQKRGQGPAPIGQPRLLPEKIVESPLAANVERRVDHPRLLVGRGLHEGVEGAVDPHVLPGLPQIHSEQVTVIEKVEHVTDSDRLHVILLRS